MTLIIVSDDNRYLWQTGDLLTDLANGITRLQEYLDEQQKLEVTKSQLSIPTAYDVPDPS